MHDVTGGVGPHAGRPIAAAGTPLGEAAGALILVHGRGGDAADMLGLAELVVPPGTLCLAPQAASHTWYPNRFTEPAVWNEPHLGSALSVLGDLVSRVLDAGLPPERIALLGFSQGACLALEFARRRMLPLGAVIGLSGGLIGDAVAPPPVSAKPFGGMPVLLGCIERDPHIPLERVRETEAVLHALGAEVATRIYPGGSHDINEDEIGLARRLLAGGRGADRTPRAASPRPGMGSAV
jgi:phospholipase/carboxylesterase